jgi:hypothetical protein
MLTRSWWSGYDLTRGRESSECAGSCLMPGLHRPAALCSNLPACAHTLLASRQHPTAACQQPAHPLFLKPVPLLPACLPVACRFVFECLSGVRQQGISGAVLADGMGLGYARAVAAC